MFLLIIDFLKDYFSAWNWWCLAIPIISAVIGWGTNVLALKMTFYPLEFKGIGIKGIRPIGWAGIPALGWQGIIPSKAADMAGKSVDMITTKLIDIKEQFANIDPKVIAKEMEGSILEMTRRITDEAVSKYVPVWKLLPEKRKESIYKKAAKEIPHVTEDIMIEVKNNITEVFDLKKMAVDQLTKDKTLLNRIFLEVGDKEFRFIEHSGIYFGFLFGILQMLIYIKFEAWWQLPVGGLFVGWLTNVLALKMIFSPVKPKRFLFWKVQGLFIKRQKAVSREYAKLVSDNVMTMPNIFEAMFNSHTTDRLLGIIERHVNEGIDQSAGFSSSLIKFTTGTKAYDDMKRFACERMIEEIPNQIHLVFDYAKQALDIEHTLDHKMSTLPPDDFVNFLRPVFQEDEWKLIAVGAILGMIAGFIQILLPIGNTIQ
ncbi:MAG: DUF445 domain-containing protein [Saprospiraceae bacterium]|nr:DUF445 domain-containing protein [Saprospiraceae bacterium]